MWLIVWSLMSCPLLFFLGASGCFLTLWPLISQLDLICTLVVLPNQICLWFPKWSLCLVCFFRTLRLCWELALLTPPSSSLSSVSKSFTILRFLYLYLSVFRTRFTSYACQFTVADSPVDPGLSCPCFTLCGGRE